MSLGPFELFMDKYDKEDCAYLIAVFENLHAHGITLTLEGEVDCNETLEKLKARMTELINA
jgi:hypothetical protein